MGKKKSSTPAERRLIWETFQKTKSVGKVSEVLGFSRGKVNNSIHYYKKKFHLQRFTAEKTTKDHESWGSKIGQDQQIRSISHLNRNQSRNGDPLRCSNIGTDRSKVFELEWPNCETKIKRVKKKNIKKRLQFAHEHWRKDSQFWKMIVWSDESKFNVFGNDGRPYVRRPPLKELDKKYTKKTVKHGGSSVVVWGCFTSSGVGSIVQINGKMTGEKYKNILNDHLNGDFADNLPLAWTFQQDNDPKHCPRVVKSWLESSKIKVLQWPAQSPDLNLIENLWGIIKRAVSARKPFNKSSLWDIIYQEWHKITPDQCATLVQTMSDRCAQIIKQNGYPTKY